MRIILKEGGSEQIVLENASLLEVTDKGVMVSALFEEPKMIRGAEVRSIDFLNGKVTVAKRGGQA
ncbi:MAG: CooT family nickel-binding protein [bacterium]